MEDFSEKIKHLRLIHFSLLIVSVVLLISEEIDEESKAVQAYNQIVAIQEAQKKWDQFDLDNHVQETLQLRDYYSNSGTQLGGNFYQNFFIEIKYLGPNLESGKESSEPKSDTLISSTFSIPVWTRVQKDGSEINKEKIENLEDFQKLWNEHLMNPHYGYGLTPSRISYFQPMKDFKPYGPEIPSHAIIESKTHLLKNPDESILGCEKLKVPVERHSKDPPYPISILWNLSIDLEQKRWMSFVEGQRVYGWEIPYSELVIIRNCHVFKSLGYYNLKYKLEERSEVKLELLTPRYSPIHGNDKSVLSFPLVVREKCCR